ncbi:MAG TPA: SH3 domain-containing protein [Clostridiaceae bacterium]|nr:SH3 domain-containing protein [Clostridiaceae bacterium]
MKRKVALLIVLTMALTLFTGIVFPDTESVTAATTFEKVNFVDATVTATKLNVRQGPSTQYSIVCTLNKGDKVKVFGKIGNWYAIYESKGGRVGAVDSRYIKMAGGGSPAPAKTPAKTPAETPKETPKEAPAPTPEEAPSVTPTDISKDEQAILDLVNKARANAGVEPLKFDMNLVKIARLKAKDMVDKGYFSHQSPTYGSPFDMMRQFGIEFKTAGENIAGNQTAEKAFNAWMGSEAHKKNILNAGFNYTGIGVVESPTYGKVFVEMFIGR